MANISHMLDYQFFGPNPVGHHLVSVLIHIVNALLLFWILTKLTGATWASTFVAAVFVLHPLQVEPVAWAAERKTVISGLFWLLTIAAYIHYTKQPQARRYILLLAVFGLCIMTKPVVVTLPLVLLLLDYWPLGRVKWERHTEDKSSKSAAKKTNLQKVSLIWLVAEKIPLLAMSAVLSVITFIAQRQDESVVSLEGAPLDLRVANMFLSYIRYIGKMIWPSQLAALYPYLPDAAVILHALLFILITIFLIYTGRRRKYAAVGWLWFVVTLIPMIGLVQVGVQAMADRYMYMPILGLLIIVAWAFKDLIASHPRWKYIATLTSAAVLFSLVILTRIQAGHWQNSLTLWEYALKVTKNNYIAENNYASALSEQGRFIESEKHLRNAVLIYPKYSDALLGLGNLLLNQKKFNEAIYYYDELVRQQKGSAEFYCNLAFALATQKKYDEAMKSLTTALELDPNFPDIHKKMGLLLLDTGKLNEAIGYFNQALITGSNKEDIYECLGTAYHRSGNYEQAIQSWTKALELKPENASILNNLAWFLATGVNVTAEDANKAIGFAERACELTEHKDSGTLDTLAAAYAAAGRFEDAVKTANKAVDIAKAAGQDSEAGEIQSKLKLYQAGQRYHQK
jgi:tetratricopeptide (TPR) repeat protein